MAKPSLGSSNFGISVFTDATKATKELTKFASHAEKQRKRMDAFLGFGPSGRKKEGPLKKATEEEKNNDELVKSIRANNLKIESEKRRIGIRNHNLLEKKKIISFHKRSKELDELQRQQTIDHNNLEQKKIDSFHRTNKLFSRVNEGTPFGTNRDALMGGGMGRSGAGGGKGGGKGANSRGSRKGMQGLLEASRGFEDALISGQIGGLRGALRASANNVSQMAFIMGGAGVGAVVGFAAAITTVLLPPLVDWISKTKSLAEVTDSAIKQIDNWVSVNDKLISSFTKLADGMSIADVVDEEGKDLNIAKTKLANSLNGELGFTELGVRLGREMSEVGGVFGEAIVNPKAKVAREHKARNQIEGLGRSGNDAAKTITFIEELKKAKEAGKLSKETLAELAKLDLNGLYNTAKATLEFQLRAKAMKVDLDKVSAAYQSQSNILKQLESTNVVDAMFSDLSDAGRKTDLFGDTIGPEERLTALKSEASAAESSLKSIDGRTLAITRDIAAEKNEKKQIEGRLTIAKKKGLETASIEKDLAASNQTINELKQDEINLLAHQADVQSVLKSAMNDVAGATIEVRKEMNRLTDIEEGVKAGDKFKTTLDGIDSELDPFGAKLKEIGKTFTTSMAQLAQAGFGKNSPQEKAIKDFNKRQKMLLKLDILGKDKTAAEKALSKVGQGGPVGAIERGSAAAFSSVQSAIRESRNNNSEPMQELVEINKKIEELQAEQLAFDKQHQTATIDSF